MIWCLCYWSLQKKKWFSVHSERNLTAVRDVMSLGHILKSQNITKGIIVHQWLWAKCCAKHLTWLISPIRTSPFRGICYYAILTDGGKWHVKCLRQGHLANMDLNPGLWLTLNHLVNQIIKLINSLIKSILFILTTTLY